MYRLQLQQLFGICSINDSLPNQAPHALTCRLVTLAIKELANVDASCTYVLTQWVLIHHTSYPTRCSNFELGLLLQFVATVEGTIFTDLFAVVSVIITAVIPAGSVQVNNTIAFTTADYTAAVAGQAAVAAVLSTGASSVFPDTSLGTVTFSAVTTGNATNPSR